MKNVLILFVVSVISIGCIKGSEIKANKKKKFESENIFVVTVDRCQYVCFQHFEGVSMVHKANCNNEIHKTK